MANITAEVRRLTYGTRYAFESATVSVAHPISAFITGEPVLVIGFKANGNYRYMRATDADIAGLNQKIATLQSAAKGSVTIPMTSAAAAYKSGTGVDNPVTFAKAVSNYGGDLTFKADYYFSGKFAEEHGLATQDVYGEGWLWVRGSLGDDYALRIYDTQENSYLGGWTGCLAEAYAVTDSQPGTWPLYRVNAGVASSETIGWVHTSEGLPMSALTFAGFGLYLSSREFTVTQDQLQQGASIEVPFCITAEGTGGGDVPAVIGIKAGIAGTSVDFLPNIASVDVAIRSTTSEPVLISGRVMIDVLERKAGSYSDVVEARTIVTFDGLNEDYLQLFSPQVDVVSFAVDEVADRCFIDIRAAGSGPVTSMAFSRASMRYGQPLVIE